MWYKYTPQQWTNRISVCIDTFSSSIVGTLYHLKASIFNINLKTANNKKNNNSNNKFMFVRTVVNCSSAMVVSIKYSTIKKKEATCIEYSAIRVTSFVS
jgi:hypothetical protein